MIKLSLMLIGLSISCGLFAEELTTQEETAQITAPANTTPKSTKQSGKDLSKEAVNAINSGNSPKMDTIIQRYFMDELMNLRREINEIRVSFVREVADRQVSTIEQVVSVNKGIQDYAINIINYFFYCIAVVVSILTLVGWRSISDIKKNANQFAGNELQKLIRTYEDRLDDIENEIKEKSRLVSKNYELLKRTNEKNAIWLKIHMESDLQLKIEYLDEILKFDERDVEALTFKAHVASQLKEFIWGLTLCDKALAIEPEYAHALYQKACIYAQLEEEEQSLRALDEAIKLSASFKKNAKDEKSFAVFANNDKFNKIIA